MRAALAEVDPEIETLIEQGDFTEAEELLKDHIADPKAPATSEAAIQLEILRRTRLDFPYTSADVLAQIRKSIPDATQRDVIRWRKSGDLQSRVIDGDARYFRAAVPNLFRINKEARKRRRPETARDEKKFDLTAHVEELVRLAETANTAEVFPVKHRVKYQLTINDDHPRLKPGAQVRAWLPFPQEYRQQRDVQLVRAEPQPTKIAENGAPQRTIYFFQQIIDDPTTPPRFSIELQFVTSAYCPELDESKVRPYDTTSALYRQFTAERPPHIIFTSDFRQLADEIVGDATNPLQRARRIFHWVSKNIPWSSEMEYSIIPNLSAKGLSARRGDCGVQGMTFITLCRAAGIPARWQSGWQMRPGDWNMHDWSEFYVEPWGWLPADASYGVREHPDPRVRDFFCGNMDAYRFIVNLDYARPLDPPKHSFRSEPNDFQRGEIEIDGHNLYFDEWDWSFEVETTPLFSIQNDQSKAAGR